MALNELPKLWTSDSLGELVVVERGSSPRPIKNFLTEDNGVNWIKIGDVKEGQKYVTKTKEQITKEGAEKSRFVKVGDFILSNSMSFGRPYIMAIDGYIHDGWFALRLPKDINSDYFYYLLSSSYVQNQFSQLAVGGLVKNISGDLVKKAELPLPPLAEQKVIAEKLDKLLAKVDSIKARLDAVPDTLKRFRQSVLAAAVSGKLTEGALKREIEYMALGDAGVEVKTGPFGSALHKSEYVSGGIPVINPMHISAGRIQPSDSMTVTETKFKELEAWHLKKGDVVVGRRGEMGRAAVVDATDEILCGTGSMILRTPENSLPKYLEIVIRSPIAVAYFTSNSVGSTMVNLNQKIIKSLQVYFPPFEEQTEIVRRVEKLFAYADKVEAEVNAAQERVNKLTQSILAKAFRGELTAKWREQNPELISGDNSAEALLEKIKNEREKLKPKNKVKSKKTVKTK